MPTDPIDPNITNPQDNPVSEPINLPPSEPEAPRNVDTPLGAKDVNEPIPTPPEDKPLEPVSPISEAPREAKAEPEQAVLPKEVPKVETPSETPTAQTPVSEPLNSTSEPLGERVEAKPIKQSQKDLWQKFLAKVQIGKRKKLEKIMTLFAKQTKITNDEVEKYLHVSDATAERYLNILEKENKIKQTGKTGKSVFYSKI